MLRRTQPKKQTHIVETQVAPIGGVNARDAIANMPESDAVNLVNWLPDTYGIRCRKGYREWAINIPGGEPVKSIMSYIAPGDVVPGGTFLSTPTTMPGKLFCATDAGIYDITDSTNAPALSRALGGSPQSGWLSSSMLTNAAGAFLMVCSESDGYFYYNGTTWTTPTMGGGAGQIANVNPANLEYVLVWKRRAWFVEKNSMRAWYLPIDSITGTANSIDFGAIFKKGGKLAYLANWTIDAGEGIDDFLVAVSTNGDVAIYKGTDPSSSTTWALVGTWNVGQVPDGRRGWAQFGGDLVLLSADGINPISYITRGGSAILQASNKEYSSKIRSPLGQDLRNSFTIRGWDMLLHPTERVLLVNVPNYGAVNAKQYALSTTVNQWAYLSDIPTTCYGFSMGYAFAGTDDGRVLLIFNGYFDNVAYGASVGNGIMGVIQPAFSYFKTPAQEKHFLMARPNFLAADTPNFKLDVSVNFSVQPPTGAPSFTPDTSSLWDIALWDSGVWSGGLKTFSAWLGVGGVGFAGSASMITTCVGDTTLTSIDYMFSVGGPL